MAVISQQFGFKVNCSIHTHSISQNQAIKGRLILCLTRLFQGVQKNPTPCSEISVSTVPAALVQLQLPALSLILVQQFKKFSTGNRTFSADPWQLKCCFRAIGRGHDPRGWRGWFQTSCSYFLGKKKDEV